MKRGTLGPQFDGPAFACGFSWRKRAYLREFTDRADIRYVGAGTDVAPGAWLFLWGSALVPVDLPRDVRVVRVEDGFLRSVGLGADLTRPLSWVLDDLGIYYDSNKVSAIEHLLQDDSFDAAELERASALRARIVQAGLTKYNLEASQRQKPPAGREVVLVAGQVERDESIARGACDVRTNLELLKAVREEKPHAWLVYKPHPDVVAGLRGRGEGEAQARRYCDELLLAGSMHELLLQVDEVHVMTSLTGFEALLRGKRVVCWGHPFYAGWGLTEDRHRHPRRSRALHVDELVAGALLRYAVYVDPATGRRCTAETALDALLEWRDRKPQVSWWRRLVRPAIARP